MVQGWRNSFNEDSYNLYSEWSITEMKRSRSSPTYVSVFNTQQLKWLLCLWEIYWILDTAVLIIIICFENNSWKSLQCNGNLKVILYRQTSVFITFFTSTRQVLLHSVTLDLLHVSLLVCADRSSASSLSRAVAGRNLFRNGCDTWTPECVILGKYV